MSVAAVTSEFRDGNLVFTGTASGNIIFQITPDGVKTILNTPKGKVWYVDKSGVDTNSGKGWNDAFLTFSKLTASGNLGNDDWVFIGAGLWAEELKIIDKRGVRIFGAGNGRTIIAGGNAATKTTISGLPFLTGGSVVGVGCIVAARGCLISGITLRGVNNAAGAYFGDGRRAGETAAKIARETTFVNCLFDGEAEAGEVGLLVDGADWYPRILNCQFHRWKDGGVIAASGVSQTTQHLEIGYCRFTGNSGYGVLRPATHVVDDLIVHHCSFEDAGGTGFTNSVKFESGGLRGKFFENSDLTANRVSGLSTDFMTLNGKRTAMNAPVYVSEA